MSRQEHPLRILLVAPTGTRNWSTALVSAALEWNAVAAYVAPVALTTYRVHASALWFAASASRTEAALAAINVFLQVERQSFLRSPVRQHPAARRGSFFVAPVRTALHPPEP